MRKAKPSEVVLELNRVRNRLATLKTKYSAQRFELLGLRSQLYAERHYVAALEKQISSTRSEAAAPPLVRRRGRRPAAVGDGAGRSLEVSHD